MERLNFRYISVSSLRVSFVGVLFFALEDEDAVSRFLRKIKVPYSLRKETSICLQKEAPLYTSEKTNA